MTLHRSLPLLTLSACLVVAACGGDDSDETGPTTTTGGPPTTESSEDWRAEVTTACDELLDDILAVPQHSGTEASVAAFVAAHRDVRRRSPRFDTFVPSEVLDGPPGLAAIDATAERALADAEEAIGGGDVDAAAAAMDVYFWQLHRSATALAVAGAQCLVADPARAAAASLNAPVELSPLNINYGFGSLWVTEHDGDHIMRVDPATGEVTATLDVPVEPIKMQPADGRMWVRTTDAIVAIDPISNETAATLPKADVGPAADRFWAVDGALWICDGQRLHRYDPTTVRPVATIELALACENVTATDDLVVAYTFNQDDGSSGTSAAAFVDPATNEVLSTLDLPVDAGPNLVIFDDLVFLSGEHESTAVVVDRDTWNITATPDLGRPTGGGTVATDGTRIYVPTADGQDLLVVDADTFAVVDTIEPLSVHSVEVVDGALWTAHFDHGVLQRFDLAR
jgi:outer membrane protein assembly factor BamB